MKKVITGKIFANLLRRKCNFIKEIDGTYVVLQIYDYSSTNKSHKKHKILIISRTKFSFLRR